jgi:hypothetical protein
MSRTSFNRTPYFDDFKPDKNYMKVLFRPSRPVQTRELNQIQSILQNQVERFANHIFKNGTRVSNARASYRTYQYVRLDEISPWNSEEVNIDYLYEGVSIVGSSSGISAIIVTSLPAEQNDPPTMYVVYKGVAVDGQTSTFIPGEILNIYDSNGIVVYSVKVRCPGCVGSNIEDSIPVTGLGTIFLIDEGVFYYEGMFVENTRQMTVVSKYGEKTSYKIGFDFVQEIITSDDDQSLLDNSLGYPNSTAPGADRYKVSLVLTKRSLLNEDGDNFILLAKIDNGDYRYLKADTEYADIMDMIAKRTYETNGNFTVDPFRLRFIEDLASDIYDDLGYSVDGDPDYVRAIVSGGISYVKGYRFQNDGEQFIKAYKARDTQKTASFIKRFDERTSINMIPLVGYSLYPNNPDESPVIDNTLINIWDGPFDVGKNPTGNIIGTFRVYDVQYVSGTVHSSGDPAIYKYFIYDLKLNSGKKISDAKCFTDSTGTNGFKANPEDASVTLYNPGKTELIWKLQRNNVKTLRSISDSGNPNPPGSIQIFLRKKLIGFLNSSGSVTFQSATNEFFEEFDPVRTVAVIIDTDQGSGIARSIDIAGKTTISTTEFILNLGTSVNIGTGTPLLTPGKMVCIVHNVLRVNSKENSKTTNFVQNDAFVPNTMINNKIFLGINDAFSIDYVKYYDISSVNDEGTDITDQFTLETNVSDFLYSESKLVFTGTLPSDSNIRWKYRVNYFEQNTSSNLGYFTVDSYKQPIADGVISYDENKTHVATNKTEYPLFGSFDFRPSVVGGNIVGNSVPVIGSTAVFDIEYFLGRTDLLCINKDNVLYIKKGVPSDKPVPPKIDDDSMALYEIYFAPYTYSINDISVKYIENKRYTMRDIGKIENRIKIIEYYTALNLLEKSADDLSIKDSNGFDRFKNGFIADNFQNFQAGDITSSDFKAALDRERRELRPSFTVRNKTLTPIASESECKFFGPIAMIDFDSVLIDEQPYATKHISVNPYFVYKQTGQMVLLPNIDSWSDTNVLPELTVNIDTGADELKKLFEAKNLLGVQWGSWVDLNRTAQTSANTSTKNEANGGSTKTTTTTTITNTQQSRAGTDITMDSRTTSYDLGERVSDVSLNPWMRETEITFLATKMTPNSRVFAFFDGKPVSEFTRQLTTNPGDDLIVDAEGQIAGIFKCPANMFHTGDRQFVLSSDENQTGDPDLEFTRAEATFFSGGLNVTKQQTTLNVVTPEFNVKKMSDSRTVTSSSSNVSAITIPGTPALPPAPPAPAPVPIPGTPPGNTQPQIQTQTQTSPQRTNREISVGLLDWIPATSDPVAQGFKLQFDCFITGIDLFFEAIDTSPEGSEIFVQLRTMENGYPSGDNNILAERKFTTDQLASYISDDSETAFHIDFDFPVYVEGDTSYCFVVGGYSPGTRIWVAKLGMPVVNQPNKIVEQQPSLESSFRSQNGATWNAEQYEDIKYKLYAAKFKKNSMSIRFKNKTEKIVLDRDPFEGEEGKSKVRVYAENHGLLPGDKTTISLYENNWVWINVPDGAGQIQIGMKIRNTANTFSGTIVDYKTDQTNTYIKIADMKGSFTNGSSFICDQMDKELHDTYLISKIGYSGSDLQSNGTVRFNTVSGTFKESSPVSSIFNGFYFSDLSKQHTVVEVDSMDTFIIQIAAGTASASGRFGGEDCSITMNEKYEVFNVAGNYLNYGSSERWVYTGIGHNTPNGIFSSQDYQTMNDKDIKIGYDTYLGVPHKMTCLDNITDSSRYVIINGVFVAPSEWISPVINTDTFSITTISNRVEWSTNEQLSIEPNAIDRFHSESDPLNGSENYKYCTKTLNLVNPATDIVILYDVYKDINADYDIWIKVVAPYEDVDIDYKRWMRVVGLNKTHHSSDLTDRVEYELTMSQYQVEVYTDDTNFTTSYWSDVVDEFSSFKIKIVGKAKNPALPPLFQSFRAIAVT